MPSIIHQCPHCEASIPIEYNTLRGQLIYTDIPDVCLLCEESLDKENIYSAVMDEVISQVHDSAREQQIDKEIMERIECHQQPPK